MITIDNGFIRGQVVLRNGEFSKSFIMEIKHDITPDQFEDALREGVVAFKVALKEFDSKK